MSSTNALEQQIVALVCKLEETKEAKRHEEARHRESRWETSFVVLCVGIKYDYYIRMAKRRIILFARLFPEVMLLFLVEKYGDRKSVV